MSAERRAVAADVDGGEQGLDGARRRLAALLLGAPWAPSLAWAARGAPPAAGGPAKAGAADEVPPGGATAANAATPVHATTGRWAHAFAAYGEPKYPADFHHFEYVNPEAPKGGTIRLRFPDRRSSFDKYNPWTTRGNAPAGILIWMVETLCHLAQDEPATMYGLLAESLNVAPDFRAVTFRLNPRARFWNGDAVTAADVVHSHAMLAGKRASPAYQNQVIGIARVTALDERTVRFEFKEPGRDQVLIAGTMPVFSRQWGGGKPFDEVTTEFPITSGAYVIDKAEMPRRIEYRLNPQYWARDLPVRRGHFNFERVVYRAYQDHAVAREAFKAGEFDLMKEYGGRSWVRLHAGPKWDDGRIVKRSLETSFGQGLQAYHLNLRRPLFGDIRVREALDWSFDYDTGNRTGIYRRAESVFSNSEFAAVGSPAAGELKLLEPFRTELPARVFGPAYRAPTTGRDPRRLRANLLRARALLEAAGWKLDDAGTLRNARGEAFVVEYLTPREGGLEDWQHNLKKLGIELKERVVDFALYRRRLERFDFDMVTIVEGDFTLPSAAELKGSYGSQAADEEGSSNYRGIKSRAVDAMLEAIAAANTLTELRDAARALDRLVMWGHFQVPDLYTNAENVSWWNRFGIPPVQAKYFSADFLISGFVEFGPWPLWCWWDAKRAAAKVPASAPASAPRA
ncbi:MAG: ABC transporter substrate-binding protein [Rubrivivax sp.]|nr:ABC transporter substrate-binding protein [Rubrivivax sp.]